MFGGGRLTLSVAAAAPPSSDRTLMPLKKSSTPAPAPGPSLAESLVSFCTGNTEQRFAAARALRSAPDAVPHLAAALETETAAPVREAIFSALAGINTAASFEAALAYLRSEDAAARSLALDAMLLMPGHAAARLPALLRDPDVDVRLLACELARALSHLASEPSPTICAAALDILSETAGPEHLEALADCGQRFPADAFLAFSVKLAAERINARAGP